MPLEDGVSGLGLGKGGEGKGEERGGGEVPCHAFGFDAADGTHCGWMVIKKSN